MSGMNSSNYNNDKEKQSMDKKQPSPSDKYMSSPSLTVLEAKDFKNITGSELDLEDNPKSERLLASSEILTHNKTKQRAQSVSATSRKPAVRREKSVKTPVSTYAKNPSSNIPLPLKSPKNNPSINSNLTTSNDIASPISMLSKCSVRSSRPSGRLVANTKTNKHTLEVQFLNKNKRLIQLKKELVEKQKPVIDLYQNLVQIKKKLEELGKIVQLEEVKLISAGEMRKSVDSDVPRTILSAGAGEIVTAETVTNMKNSIEEIPKTLMEICQNLLSRRAVIVELLESVTKSEVDVTDLSGKIESLKTEGTELQKSLDAIIGEHESKINDLVLNWQKLLSEKKSEIKSYKIDELQSKLKEQEELIQKSNQMFQELHKKLDEKKASHDRSVVELNSIIVDLRERIRVMESEIEHEKKLASDHKSKNNTNSQTIKALKSRIAELEGKTKDADDKSGDLSRKIKYLQDQLKTKESIWTKEKDDLQKNLKTQENLLHKLTGDRNEFEARARRAESKKTEGETELHDCITTLRKDLKEAKLRAEQAVAEKEEIQTKFIEMQDHLKMMGLESKMQMDLVTQSVEWGKAAPGPEHESEIYTNVLANQVMVRQLQDKVRQYEIERQYYVDSPVLGTLVSDHLLEDDKKMLILKHQECITRYQQLLEESEEKLREKSNEVMILSSEIRHLKVRQDVLEEQNCTCPTKELQKMIEEGRQKLNELMKKSIESEQRIANYETVIERQNKQMNEMENLLRYRENMTGILKANRDELMMDKESLMRYSQELRNVLAEVSKECKIKERVIKELQEKLDLRERQINKLEKEVKGLEANLLMTNEKRFILQDTLGSMEKELQSTKALSNQYSEIQSRYGVGRQNSKSFISNKSRSPSTSSTTPIYSPRKFVAKKYKSKIRHYHHQKHHLHPIGDDFRKSYRDEATNADETGNVNYLGKGDINSRALIGQSMKQIDFLRNRLKYLTTLNVIVNSDIDLKDQDKYNVPVMRTCSTQTLVSKPSAKLIETKNNTTSVHGMVDLMAKRYELLRKQADECYDDLSTLLKMSVSKSVGTVNLLEAVKITSEQSLET